MDTAVCHPDDIPYHHMSSGWLSWNWYLILMSYDNVIMSSGWHTILFLSHPDEIASFNFSQHAVALSVCNRPVYQCARYVWQTDMWVTCGKMSVFFIIFIDMYRMSGICRTRENNLVIIALNIRWMVFWLIWPLQTSTQLLFIYPFDEFVLLIKRSGYEYHKIWDRWKNLCFDTLLVKAILHPWHRSKFTQNVKLMNNKTKMKQKEMNSSRLRCTTHTSTLSHPCILTVAAAMMRYLNPVTKTEVPFQRNFLHWLYRK